jgi:hypothetical protein
MANLKVTIPARQLLTFVTPAAILEHFTIQQEHALEKGKISKTVRPRKLEEFSEDCAQSFKRELRACRTPRDVAILNRALLKQIAPNRMGFLLAVWKHNKHDTIAALN